MTAAAVRTALVAAIAEVDALTVEPPPPPPPPPPTTVRQYRLFSGADGPSKFAWNSRMPYRWTRPCGDWIDANGTKLGAVPFATFRANPMAAGAAPVAHSIDVLALARKWVGGTNRGIFMRSIGPSNWVAIFGGETHATAALRPIVTVVTDRGTFVLPCRASCHVSTSTEANMNARAQFGVAPNDNLNPMLQFEDEEVPRDAVVSSATMTLWQTVLDKSSHQTVEVYELDPPWVRVSNDGQAPVPGIAADYICDEGLENHPDIIFKTDFRNPNDKNGNPPGPWDAAGGNLRTTHPNPVTEGRTTYVRDGFAAAAPDDHHAQLWGGGYIKNLERGVIRDKTAPRNDPRNAGIPIDPPLVVNMRYYLYFEEGWGDRKSSYKLPGLTAAYWYYTDTGQWQMSTGNGGAKGNGRYEWGPFPGYNDGWLYHGHSFRGHGEMGGLPGDEYKDVFSMRLYVYNNDQVGSFGDMLEFGGVIPVRTWTCLEIEAGMNDVDMSVVDANGNGRAIRNGYIQTYIDGTRYRRLGNLSWRCHPAYGIQAIWAELYHGGQAPASNPDHAQFAYFDMFAASRGRYIGPARLPSGELLIAKRM